MCDEQKDTHRLDVSGVELVMMLETRDRVASLELSPGDLEDLRAADLRLEQGARRICDSLQDFVDLEATRRIRRTPPENWWWYLDIVAALPTRD